VAAGTQRERQREERDQVAGRADPDDDVVLRFDADLLLEYEFVYQEILPMRL
jgi:hypothetical protein